jgi:gamma-polyglutamate biosynthesis protein CapA
MNLRQFFVGRAIGFVAVLVAGVLAYSLAAHRNVKVTPIDQAGSSTSTTTTTASSTAKILFGGDVFFDRAIRRTIEKRGVDYLWDDISPLLAQYPYKVANLEGPILETPEAGAINTFQFAFQPEYVMKLKDLGFTAVSLANNHTLNQGTEGLANTRKELDKMGLPYFGDPSDIASLSFLEKDFNGHMIALVGEHDLLPDSEAGQAAVLAKVTALKKKGDFVIVYPHWGVEYATSTPDVERERAHKLVDAGADLIIGSHPHVVQPIELYKGKIIFYSLGNFLFDQYFSFDTLHGLLVGMELTDSTATFTLLPTEQDKTYQIHQAPSGVRQGLLDRIASDSTASAALKSAIRTGVFSVPIK